MKQNINEFFNGLENTDEVKAFFDQCKVYEKLLENDYAGHKEIYSYFHDFILKTPFKNFNLLDLGCGGADFMAKALNFTSIKSYIGVDLSSFSLKLAKENLKKIECDKQFYEEDFFNFFENRQCKFDIIWMGLSLHHLLLKQKKIVLKKIYQALKPGGYFFLFDTFLNEHETREQYLLRWKHLCERHWTNLSPHEKQDIEKHVMKADFPESISEMKKLGYEFGYKDIKIVFEKLKEKYGLIKFYK